jgi:hypothetical protein
MKKNSCVSIYYNTYVKRTILYDKIRWRGPRTYLLHDLQAYPVGCLGLSTIEGVFFTSLDGYGVATWT